MVQVVFWQLLNSAAWRPGQCEVSTPWRDDCKRSYDRIAGEYVARLADELDSKPFDRAWLEAFASELRGAGRVADIGCGPGHVSAFLAARGLDVVGIDMSSEMLERACEVACEVAFLEADMTRLGDAVGESSLAGAIAFYSIIHVPRAEHPRLVTEFARALSGRIPSHSRSGGDRECRWSFISTRWKRSAPRSRRA